MEAKKRNNPEDNKVRSNLISIFLINTVVLFTLTLISFIYLNSTSIENYFKENVTVNVYLKNDSKESENKQLIKFLSLNDEVKNVSYLSKEDAAKIFSSEIGEEFVGFLGYNPLLDAISVQLNGDKIDIDARKGTINVRLTKSQLLLRKKKWKSKKSSFGSGTLWKYAQTVGPAYLGAPTHPSKKKEVKTYSDI